MQSRRLVGVTIGLLALMTFSACAAVQAPRSTSAPLQSGESGARAPAAAATAGPAAAAPPASVAGGSGNLPSNAAALQDRRIIYTGDLTLEAKDPLETINTITNLVKQFRGYVATSSATYQGERQVATVSLRVPSEAYMDTMASLKKVGDKVRDEKTSSQDVSEEYADLNAQVRNLQVTENQYLEFMKRANTIDEVLKVQQQLTTVRGQIERIKGRLTYLERRSDEATINVTVVAPTVQTRKPGEIPNPLDAVADSWDASIRFLATIASAGVAIVVFFWWLIPPTVLFVWWLRSRMGRRRTAAPAAS